jgi:hypothetical protein
VKRAGTEIMMHFKYGFYLSLVVVLSMLAACSAVKTYPNTLDKNLHVGTKTDSGVDAAIEIFEVKPDCSIKYSGTIQLDNPVIDVGIPTGRSSYLVFVFSSSGFFTGSNTITYDTLLRPRKDARYDIDVRYQQDIYNVVINERLGSNKSQEIEVKSLAECKPL